MHDQSIDNPHQTQPPWKTRSEINPAVFFAMFNGFRGVQARGQSGLTRFEPDQPITPCNAEVRRRLPYVIYELQSEAAEDQVLVKTAISALQAHGYNLEIDAEEKTKEHPNYTVFVRSGTKDEKKLAVEGALLLGLVEATKVAIASLPTEKAPITTKGYFQEASLTSYSLIHEFLGRKKLVKTFEEFYGGLRWSTDQHKLVKHIFLFGTPYDPSYIENNISGRMLTSLLYHIDGVSISYDINKNWDKMDPESILTQYPELDYHQLQNDQFTQSPEGQILIEAYAEVCGDAVADRFDSVFADISEDGILLPKPRIPLTQFPILEALIASGQTVDRPQPKYAFGAEDVVKMIIKSDSSYAHGVLVESIISRLPKDQRYVIDGPNELQHKRGNINTIIKQYRDLPDYEQAQSLESTDLLAILEAFTLDGRIAESVRKEFQKALVRKGEHNPYTSEVYDVKNITTDLLSVAMASGNSSLIALAEDLVTYYLPDKHQKSIAQKDLLVLSRDELKISLLNSLQLITRFSDMDALERITNRIFQNQDIGQYIRSLAQRRIQIQKIYNSREALLARRHWLSFGHPLGKDPEEENARRAYSRIVRPAEELTLLLDQDENQFYLGLLQEILNQQPENPEHLKLFTHYLSHVRLHLTTLTDSLPNEYDTLIKMTTSPSITGDQINSILWHFHNEFRSLYDEETYLLVQVISDIYRISFGPVDHIRLPTDNTSHGFSAASTLVYEHRYNIFKSATQEQLETFEKYARVLGQYHALLSGQKYEDLKQNFAITTPKSEEWRKKTLQNLQFIAQYMKQIQDVYKQYMLLEAVKVKPNLYYPWMLTKLMPFLQRIEEQVNPENKPERNILELYTVMIDLWNNYLVRKESLPENFDCIKEGHLDLLLLTAFDRMVKDYEIQYNGAVWMEGFSFISNATHNMPETVFKELIEKYHTTRPDFAEWLQKEHARWNEDNTTDIT
jgi:hypothetical protein